ncbi:hypothetical protein AYO49_02130 [Verrucomicrobiaceae bacterium SCGC AG-212-N21]|nr:hypothetical protein AYO49_02130 [Verrucomicrobiaceae bacterium SCGC AG-212-N21]
MKGTPVTQVLARLRSADRAWQKQRATVLFLRHWKWLLLAVTALLVADIILHLDGRQRLLLDLALVIVTLGALAWLLRYAWWQANPPERIARLLESRSPALGSKLINLLHLREKFLAQPHASPLTRSLAEQAVNDAATNVGQVFFLPLTKEPGMNRLAWHALAPSLGFVVLALIFFMPFLTTLVRFLDPLGDHPPFSMTRLWVEEPSAENPSVLYGGNFLVKARWSGHDPKELFITAQPPDKPEDAFTLPLMAQEPGLFVQQLENVRTDLLLRVHTRNHWSTSAVARLAVVLTPQFASATLAVAPPAYTTLPEKTTAFNFAGATALKGSRVTFTLRSNRPLKEGRLHLATAAGQPQMIALAVGATPQEVSGSFTAEASGRMTFTLVDVDGIPSDDVKKSSFTVTHDLAPTVTVVEPARDGFLVEGYSMPVRATASDDYGLKLLRMQILRGSAAERPVEHRHDKPVLSDAVEIPLRERFFPALVDGEVISFYAEAIDNHPDPPHVARSEVRKLTVISRMQYNNILRRENTIADLEAKYEDLFQQFHELLEKQKQLAAAAAETEKKLGEKPGDADLQKQQESQRKTQAELNKELLKFAQNMDQFVSDMPLYDVEKDFQQQLTEQASGIRESVAQNERDMRGTDPVMSRAAREHHDRMAGAQEQTESQIEKAIADAAELQEMMDNFSRFEELHRRQEQLAQQMSAYKEQARLSDEDRIAVASLGAEQREIGGEITELIQKLNSDADKNAAKYPKASESCRQLAAAMSDARMHHLASEAASRIMKGDGQGGHAGAERLREAMEALFGECNGGQENASGELDTRLSLNHCKNPGRTAEQMAMSRKFGRGSKMNGQGSGMGGYRTADDASGGAAVYGMESKLGRVNNGPGDGEAPTDPNAPAQAMVTSNTVNSEPAQVNRATDAVSASTTLEKYRALTDAYFDRITGKKEENKP